MAAAARAYTADMVASLVAALACAIATPQSCPPDAIGPMSRVAADAGASRVPAMSLPAELGPLSSPPLELAGSFDVPAAPRSATAAPMTPLEVDSVGGAPSSSGADWSALATRFDAVGACCFFVPAGRGRTAMLQPARGRAARHVSAGAISAAPESLLPDGHGAPILWPARLAVAPALVVATLARPTPPTPLAPAGSRIDRPPRS